MGGLQLPTNLGSLEDTPASVYWSLCSILHCPTARSLFPPRMLLLPFPPAALGTAAVPTATNSTALLLAIRPTKAVLPCFAVRLNPRGSLTAYPGPPAQPDSSRPLAHLTSPRENPASDPPACPPLLAPQTQDATASSG